MSYASVLAENAPPVDEQPKPDPNLLEGQGDHLPNEKREDDKSGENNDEHRSNHTNEDRSSSTVKEDQVKQEAKKVAKEGKRQLQDPKNQAAAISLVNVITLSATAFIALKYWNKPHWDKRVVSGLIVGVSAIMGGQGYLAKLFSNFQSKH
ncbi:hypothetical protein PTTG_02370 [Puccinia triticina 1-1 BBBD Race 1]|uniref:Uncharacterized protein n=2 Tax=Puccinia triticina TaxID=208348 RepID=A0A180H2R6_PUCT1|nr:uncharacterized protein PtA15_4A227 [Puccinia triticina]OAV99101.1 hypothetical protein PTTG_02370 [Puccinia triticina 1-1 BBBD Race 1]WAQ83778.1 hypothetical protein PtA15_4A227 [Puccinia triticina]WAR54620.1 hypothetical protein PtB15_4B237 [Puccinia triticina]